ncbi:nucleotidyltransferase domain-containing protein [Candidatus Bathyarchaeota archaeon]|nr:nucleotidyltransferase domain-containing protein [Candidatus Bathyarchaeota archaeon]
MAVGQHLVWVTVFNGPSGYPLLAVRWLEYVFCGLCGEKNIPVYIKRDTRVYLHALTDRYATRLLLRVRDLKSARFSDLKEVIGNPRTLTVKIQRLIEMGLIQSGGNRYTLSSLGEEACTLLERLEEALRQAKVEVSGVERVPHAYYASLLRRYCRILIDHYGERLFGVLVFGSVARGDWDKDSDLDLLLIVSGWEEKPAWERVRELLSLRPRLKETVEYKSAREKGYLPVIQHHPLSSSEAKRFQRLSVDVCVDGIILYDKDGFLRSLMEDYRRRLREQGAKRILLPGRGYYWILRDVRAGEVYTI